jgi:hypothetical protein
VIAGEEEERMPLIEARLLEGVFSSDEREQLAEGLITPSSALRVRASAAKRKC